jgi:hypothetical protein
MKKRFLQTGLALAAILVAVGLLGCPTPDDTKPKPKQTEADLEWVTIGTVEDTYPNELGTADLADVLDSAYDAAEIPLTDAQKNGSVTYGLADSSNKAKVEVARIAADDTATATTATFSSALGNRTWADSDWLVVKVTSEDGKTVNYYRFNVTLGKNAFLASVTIGTTKQTSKTWLGEPGDGDDFNAIVIGDFQTDHITGASVFLPLPQDEAATVSYLFKVGVPSDWPSETLAEFDFETNPTGIPFNLTLDDDLYLYIKVESTSNPPVILYYVMELVFPKTAEISYGVPKLVNPSAPGDAFYIDPIWDTVDWDFDISRANQAENVPAYFKDGYGKHTSGRAKALWDDNGIWVLVDADVSQFRTTASGTPVDRPITPTTDHNGDSIEIFINERLQILGTDTASSSDLGNQFRLGVAGDRTGETAANNNGGDAKPTLAPFNDPTFTKFRTVLKKPAGHGNTLAANYAGSLDEATNGGFILIAYAPFKLKASDNASDVFDSSGKVKTDAKIGFELQLNVNSGSSRDGILTWNGLNTMAYQNAAGYGVVTLIRGTNPDGSATVFPEITAQALSDAQYLIGATTTTALSVTTTGTIQWFSSPTQYGPGTAIPSATTGTYTPSAITAGTNYYYAVVTSGGVSVVTNRRAKIEVMSADDLAEKWTFENVPFSKAASPASLETDGSINLAAAGGEVFGYKFPIGNFYQVAITVEGTSGGTAGTLALASKQMAATNGDTQTTDALTGGDLTITVPASGTFTQTFTYKIGAGPTGGTGDSANLYNGGIVWDATGNTTAVTGFAITKAVFYVPEAVAGDSFYVNIADVDQRNGAAGGFGDFAKKEYLLDTDGTPMSKLTYATTGDSNGRARAVINLSTKITEALGVAVANNPPAYTVTITGTATGSPSLWFGESATSSSDWNVFNFNNDGTINATAPVDYTLAVNSPAAGKKATVFLARVGNINGTDTLTVKSIKLTPIGYTAVTSITGVPTSVVTEKTLPLTGIVQPSTATNKTIVWSLEDTDTTGSTLSGSTLTAGSTAGKVTVTATITNGASETTDYTQDFEINVIAPPPAWNTDTPANASALTPKTNSHTGLTVTGNVVTVASTDNTAMVFYYELPTNWLDYATIKITYTAAKTTTPAKVTIKKGANSTTDTTPAHYQDVSDGTGNTYSWPTSEFAGATTPGVSFQVNNYASADNTQDWTFEATKIELIP